jgi:hypothetical protein
MRHPLDPEPEQEVAEARIERAGRGAVAVRGRARVVAPFRPARLYHPACTTCHRTGMTCRNA